MAFQPVPGPLKGGAAGSKGCLFCQFWLWQTVHTTFSALRLKRLAMSASKGSAGFGARMSVRTHRVQTSPATKLGEVASMKSRVIPASSGTAAPEVPEPLPPAELVQPKVAKPASPPPVTVIV